MTVSQIQEIYQKFTVTVRHVFPYLQETDHDDLVQEALLIAFRRSILKPGLKFIARRSLLLDAYRAIFGYRESSKRQTFEFPVWFSDDYNENASMWLAVPPNQWPEMEARDKLLSPEEAEFETELLNERRIEPSVKREIQTRMATDSLPFSTSDFVEFVVRGA